MKKEQLKTIALCLAAVLLTANTVAIYKLNQELDSHFFKAVQIQNTLESLRSDVSSQRLEMESLLKESESILLEHSIDYRLKNDKIEVTVHAMPKELEAGEIVIAKIAAGDQIYEARVDESNSASILVEPTDVIKTMIQIQSESGVRQQVLEERQTGTILGCKTTSEWLDDSNTGSHPGLLLNLQIMGQECGLPFEKEDMKTAEFVVVNSGNYEDGIVKEHYASTGGSTDHQSALDFLENLEGDRIPAQLLNFSDSYMLFRGDFTEYHNRKDGILYDVAFVLETKDGLIYTEQYDYTASFSSDEDSSHGSSGDGMIVPVFRK